MVALIKRIFGGSDAPSPRRRKGRRFDSPLEIDRPTYAIGDVHGRFDLMERLLKDVAVDAAERGYADHRIVFLGDYVDRGEQSAQTLLALRGLLSADAPPEIHALRGNHEEMMLRFIEDPESRGPIWLHNGGLQTMLSFGVGIAPSADEAALVDAARRLEDAAGPVLPMMRDLPTWLRFGNVLFAHAGADPELPPELQSDRTLIWGTTRFHQSLRTDGLWCVHGHYVVGEADAALGRVSVDTGAYYTGVLTAACLADGEVRFLST